VGFPRSHALVFQRVATQMNTVISCREVGKVSTGLIEEGYALKGFRVDTKSCNWGPMAGFVCMDPRLNKAVYEKELFNRAMTAEALSGAIHKTGGTEGDNLAALSADWRANYHPLVIWRERINQLLALRAIDAAVPDTGGVEVASAIGTPGFRGTSSKGGLTIKWRLIRLRPGLFPGVGADHYGVFVEADQVFSPEYIGGARRLVTQVKVGHSRYVPHHALLGLTNPLPRGRGAQFKDCVTGDYDLFGVWPRNEAAGRAPMAKPTAGELQAAKARLGPGARPLIPAANENNWDIRPKDRYIRADEHYQLGNISRRVNLIKIMLNTALQARGSGAVGASSQLVHHSDEVGNPDAVLAKPLLECLPIIGFLPGDHAAYTMETIADLKTFVAASGARGFTPHLKPDWRADLHD
jgi:hypothetical protein